MLSPSKLGASYKKKEHIFLQLKSHEISEMSTKVFSNALSLSKGPGIATLKKPNLLSKMDVQVL